MFGRYNVKILSTTDTSFMSTNGDKEIFVKKHLGMVDTTIYRKIYMETFTLGMSSHTNNRGIARSIEQAIKETNEIMKSKVSAIHGNCILGYKI